VFFENGSLKNLESFEFDRWL